MKILYVEDNDDNVYVVRQRLTRAGFTVLVAADGAHGIALATAEQPDLILMDLSLPILDGWEATRRLKMDERTRHIPIVALTGHALAGHAEGARQAGCDSFVTKPCLPDALVAEIHRMLSIQSAEGLPGRPPRTTTRTKQS